MLLWQSGAVLSITLALSPALSRPAVRSSYNWYINSEARPHRTERQLACQVLALAISTHSKISRESLMLSLGAEHPTLSCLGDRGAPGVCKDIISP